MINLAISSAMISSLQRFDHCLERVSTPLVFSLALHDGWLVLRSQHTIIGPPLARRRLRAAFIPSHSFAEALGDAYKPVNLILAYLTLSICQSFPLCALSLLSNPLCLERKAMSMLGLPHLLGLCAGIEMILLSNLSGGIEYKSEWRNE